jgi:DNA-binding NarL/FixJ family response regulator
MDIRMEGMTGIEAATLIINEHPDAKILFLTTFLDNDYIIQALHIGAKGYILKQDFECILPSLKAVNSGQNVFGNEIVSKIPNLMQNTGAKDYSVFGITEKEYEMIENVAKGLSNKEIAEALYLSEGTIRNYLSTILEKLNLRDRTQLAIFYYNH